MMQEGNDSFRLKGIVRWVIRIVLNEFSVWYMQVSTILKHVYAMIRIFQYCMRATKLKRFVKIT